MATKAALSVLILFMPFISVGSLTLVIGQKTWCVAKPSSNHTSLNNNLNYVCNILDCNTIWNKDNPCYYPDTIINHASIAMNLYYQVNGRHTWECDFMNSGLISLTDPSYGDCKYDWNEGKH